MKNKHKFKLFSLLMLFAGFMSIAVSSFADAKESIVANAANENEYSIELNRSSIPLENFSPSTKIPICTHLNDTALAFDAEITNLSPGSSTRFLFSHTYEDKPDVVFMTTEAIMNMLLTKIEIDICYDNPNVLLHSSSDVDLDIPITQGGLFTFDFTKQGHDYYDVSLTTRDTLNDLYINYIKLYYRPIVPIEIPKFKTTTFSITPQVVTDFNNAGQEFLEINIPELNTKAHLQLISVELDETNTYVNPLPHDVIHLKIEGNYYIKSLKINYVDYKYTSLGEVYTFKEDGSFLSYENSLDETLIVGPHHDSDTLRKEVKYEITKKSQPYEANAYATSIDFVIANDFKFEMSNYQFVDGEDSIFVGRTYDLIVNFYNLDKNLLPYVKFKAPLSNELFHVEDQLIVDYEKCTIALRVKFLDGGTNIIVKVGPEIHYGNHDYYPTNYCECKSSPYAPELMYDKQGLKLPVGIESTITIVPRYASGVFDIKNVTWQLDAKEGALQITSTNLNEKSITFIPLMENTWVTINATCELENAKNIPVKQSTFDFVKYEDKDLSYIINHVDDGNGLGFHTTGIYYGIVNHKALVAANDGSSAECIVYSEFFKQCNPTLFCEVEMYLRKRTSGYPAHDAYDILHCKVINPNVNMPNLPVERINFFNTEEHAGHINAHHYYDNKFVVVKDIFGAKILNKTQIEINNGKQTFMIIFSNETLLNNAMAEINKYISQKQAFALVTNVHSYTTGSTMTQQVYKFRLYYNEICRVFSNPFANFLDILDMGNGYPQQGTCHEKFKNAKENLLNSTLEEQQFIKNLDVNCPTYKRYTAWAKACHEDPWSQAKMDMNNNVAFDEVSNIIFISLSIASSLIVVVFFAFVKRKKVRH